MTNKAILRNYIIYFVLLLLVCIIGASKVFAYDYDNIGYFNNQTQVQVEVNYTNNPISVPINATYQLSGVYSLDMFVSNVSLDPNYVYWFEIYLPNTILTNANSVQVIDQTTGHNNSSCTVLTSYFGNNYPHVTFQCSANSNITALYIKYYNSSNQYLFEPQVFTWNYTYMRKRVPDSANDTGEIKDAITQNSQDIINNQNQNTQDIINSNRVCNNIDKVDVVLPNKNLADDGTIGTTNDLGITDYISINDNSTLEQLTLQNSSVNAYMCFYNINKNLISCLSSKNHGIGTINFPSSTSYVRFTIIISENKPSFKICKNGNQAVDDSINKLDDTLNDDSIDTTDADSFFDNFNDNTHGLSGIISAPLVSINSMLNNQCSPLSATWRGQTVSFECGYTFWNRLTGFKDFLNVAIDGLLCYRILIKLFKLIEKMKNPNDDRVEVMDL